MSVDNVNSKRSLLENIDKIEMTDTLTDFVEKCNDNFTAIVKNGGGPKGDRGVKGDQGNPTKPKVPIHVWKKGVDYTSETQTETGFKITYENGILSDVKYQENHLILLENAHVYKIVLDKFTLKPEFVFELPYFNPDDIKTNLHIACADSYDGSKYAGFKVVTNTFDPIQKPYVGIYINDDDEDSESLNNQYIYNWIYIGGFGSGSGDSGGTGGGSGTGGSGDGKCIYVTLSNDNGNFIYSDINSSDPISGPVSTIARLEINGEPVNNDYVDWSYSCPLGNAIVNEENINNGEFVVNGISGDTMSSSLIITATYNKVTYPKVFSLRKYINESTYDINPTITTLTLLDTSSKPIDIYFQIKETTTTNKHIYYPREKDDWIFGDSKVLNLFIELIQEGTEQGIKLTQLDNKSYTTVIDISNNYYKLTINDVNEFDINTLKDYNTLRININKESSDFKEYEDISIVSIESSLDINAGFKSTVFTRSDIKPKTPEGGTWLDPVPPSGEDTAGNTIKWSDGIPKAEKGAEKLWSSCKIFYSNDAINKKNEWSEPWEVVDTSSFEVIFSTFDNPIKLNEGDFNPPNYPKYDKDSATVNYWTDDVEDSEKTLWMATATCNNGVWSQWNPTYIKGEKGDNGTSINIKGSGKKVDVLPTNNTGGNVVLYTDKNIIPNKPWIYLWNDESNRFEGFPTPRVHNDSIRGYTYIIDGYLYVWDGDTWVDCGEFKGEKGDNTYLHIKYANDATRNEIDQKKAFQRTIDGKNIWITPTDKNGEVPGKYIGICTSTSDTRPNDPEPNNIDYKWSKWNGEDGWGYDYIYCLTKTYDAPKVPNTTGPYDPNDTNFTVIDSVSESRTLTWKDDPQDVTKEMPYCWVCYSQFMNGAWTDYKGNSTKPHQGVIWSKWSKDGEGKDIRLDLDNQNDFLIYNNSGELVSESVSTIAKLYENGKPVNAKFSISDYSNCTCDIYNINDTSYNGTYNVEGVKVVVKGLSDGAASGYATIKATYKENDKENDYSAKFNVKRLISQNKYQLIVSPTAISYDDGVSITKEVTIQVRKTDGSTGKTTIMDKLDSGFSLCYKLDNKTTEYSLTYKDTLDWTNSLATSNIQIILKEVKDDGTEITWDSEDIPIFKGGKTGKSGKIPYYAGVYSSSDIYQQTDTATPYVFYNSNNVNDNKSGYYLLISNSAYDQDPTAKNSKYWLKMDQFEAIYSNVGVIKQALVGGAVFDKDWIYSQAGFKYKCTVDSTGNEAAIEINNLDDAYNNTIIKNIINTDTKNRKLIVHNIDQNINSNDAFDALFYYGKYGYNRPLNVPIGEELLCAICAGYYVPVAKDKISSTSGQLFINGLEKTHGSNRYLFISIYTGQGNSKDRELALTLSGMKYTIYKYTLDEDGDVDSSIKARRFNINKHVNSTTVNNINGLCGGMKLADNINGNIIYRVTEHVLCSLFKVRIDRIENSENEKYENFNSTLAKTLPYANSTGVFSPNWAVNLKTGSMWTGGGLCSMRKDGSGHLANGRISWDVDGNLYLPPTGTLNLISKPGDTALMFKYYVANGTSLTPAGPINVQIKIRAVYSNGSYADITSSETYIHGATEKFPFSNQWFVSVEYISNKIVDLELSNYDRISATLYIDNMPSQEIEITNYVVQVFTYNLTKESYMSAYMNVILCGYIDINGMGKLGNDSYGNPVPIYENVKQLQSVGGTHGPYFSDGVLEKSAREIFGSTIDFDNVICVLKLQHVVDDVNSSDFKPYLAKIKLGTNADSLYDFGTSGTKRWNTNDNSVSEIDLNIPVVSGLNGDSWYYIGIKPTSGLSSGFSMVHALLNRR